MFPDKNMRPAIVSAVKREFHGHSKHLEHNKPEQFCKTQWHGHGSTIGIWIFLVYRWLLSLFLTSSLIISIIDIRTLGWPEESIRRAKWFIYMTNWALFGLTLQALIAAYLATKYHLALGNTEQSMTKLHKIYWVLNNLSNALAPAITIGYWATVYNPDIHRIDYLNIYAHVMNTVIVIIDVWIAGHPIRLLHAYQPAVLAFIYSGFSAIYYLAGGTNRDGSPKIYPLLNWDKPHWAILATLGASIFLVIIHISFWLMFLLRRRIAVAWIGRQRIAQISAQDMSVEVTITSGLV